MTKSLKTKVEKLEKRYRYIADNLLDAIWVVDAQTLKFEFITPSIERISGFSAEDFQGLGIGEQVTPESFEKIINILKCEKKQFDRGIRITRAIELEAIHKDGSTYWIEVRAKFMKDDDGVVKIVGITKEISEQKADEFRQENLIRKLSETLAEKERLIKEIKVLQGLLPICSGCKRIRDENNRWWPLDAYIQEKTEVNLTHTICPDCNEVFYGHLKET